MAKAKRPYLLVRSKRRKRTLSLQVQRDGSVVIQAPWRVPLAEIDDFYERKKSWIGRRLDERLIQQPLRKPEAFSSGERFFYLGIPHPLEVVDESGIKEPLSFTGDRFILQGAYVPQGSRLFFEWYRAQAETHLAERLRHYGKQMDLPSIDFRLSDARHRWGSCSPHNRLSLNWRLIMTPPAVIDYVVIHELMHRREKNHSRNFWQLVEAVMPDYRQHQRWLKKHVHLLEFP
ncbi:MAG: M48 family metallopeptidase, partial [Deltaproteobacteria bacterium]|nr:M48 family metallopeptidase [Deltaproteobacteria bacterium]